MRVKEKTNVHRKLTNGQDREREREKDSRSSRKFLVCYERCVVAWLEIWQSLVQFAIFEHYINTRKCVKVCLIIYYCERSSMINKPPSFNFFKSRHVPLCESRFYYFANVS